MKAREVLSAIEADGWTEVRVSGSHHVFKHPLKPGIVVIPVHSLNDDVPRGTLNSILKQAGLK